ncbi:hypothetical protein ANCCAN_29664 [Ancylostoma caninum]|uniref:Uncharacterized protein n=1 Tax=Ancylostoma caninum TaxID=29170 RepID=A0A368F358_ANCCA|nr:hypothetical protein ANCCAN_29664 [Ancylostoma caninum]
MVHERIQADKVDVSVLGTPLTFRNYRKAKNRFLKVGKVHSSIRIFSVSNAFLFKASLTERISTWDVEDLSMRGIPTQELINIYDKWGHGGFGVILTGNVMVEPVSGIQDIRLCQVLLTEVRKGIHRLSFRKNHSMP